MQAHFNLININICGKEAADISQTNRALNPPVL
jgi:hypothetical protein